jgi:hypothetical protein
MNYADLVQAITDYTENLETSFVSQIPNFVEQAEERIYRSVMIPELRKQCDCVDELRAISTLLAHQTSSSVFSIAVINGDGDYTYLLDKDVNFIREAFPSSSTQGLPQFYGQFDGDTSTRIKHRQLHPRPHARRKLQQLSCITISTLRPS